MSLRIENTNVKSYVECFDILEAIKNLILEIIRGIILTLGMIFLCENARNNFKECDRIRKKIEEMTLYNKTDVSFSIHKVMQSCLIPT